LERFPVDPGAPVEALEESDRGELDEVRVADAVLGEQHEMGVARRDVHGLLPFVPAAEGEVRFEAENGPHTAGFRLGVELPGPVQVAVIGERQRIHAQRPDPVEQVGDPVGAVEEGVLAVGVEVDERHAATALARPAPRARGRGEVAWLRVARGRALLPQLAARAAAVVGLAGRARPFQGLAVGVRHHQHLAGERALRHDGDESVGPEAHGLNPIVGGGGHSLNLSALPCIVKIPAAGISLRPMGWVASVFALGLIMALLHRLTAGSPVEARATLALGFLLLAALAGGELAKRVRLPRVTGALLIGFAASPAITLAMIDEMRARGPLARSLLAVTVAQDVAVPILFTAVLLGSKALASAGALQLTVAGVAALELAGSLAVGVAIGALLAQYTRLLRGPEAAWLVAAALLAAVAARLLRLEPLLIGLAAGVYLENFSPVERGRLGHD